MSKSKFFERSSIFAPKYVAHTVGEQEFHFYSVSTGMLWRLQTAFGPIIKAFTLLSARTGENDYRRMVDAELGADGKPTRTMTQIDAVDPVLAKFRQDEKSKAITEAMDCFFRDENRMLLGALITDSLRDDFVRGEAKEKDVIESVLDSLDLESLVGMLHGVLKANAKVFGPLAERVREALQSRIQEMIPRSESAPTPMPQPSPTEEILESENESPLPAKQPTLVKSTE